MYYRTDKLIQRYGHGIDLLRLIAYALNSVLYRRSTRSSCAHAMSELDICRCTNSPSYARRRIDSRAQAGTVISTVPRNRMYRRFRASCIALNLHRTAWQSNCISHVWRWKVGRT